MADFKRAILIFMQPSQLCSPSPFLIRQIKPVSMTSTFEVPIFTSRDDRKRLDSQKVGLGLPSYVRGFSTFAGTLRALGGAGAIYFLSDDHANVSWPRFRNQKIARRFPMCNSASGQRTQCFPPLGISAQPSITRVYPRAPPL